VVVGPEGFSLHQKTTVTHVGALIARHFEGTDIVLAEGFSSARGRKLLVHRRGVTSKPLAHSEEVFLAVTDEPLGYPAETEPDDIDSVASTLAAFVEESSAPEVTLAVDGVDIPLTEFVRRFLAGALVGMVGELKGIPAEPHEISVVVRRG